MLRDKLRRDIFLGALLTVLGLGIAATAPVFGEDGRQTQPQAGGVLVLAGWAVLAWSIHRFGRAQAS